jgi:hypothetical protein
MKLRMNELLDRVFPERVFRRSVIERLDRLDRLQRSRVGKIKTHVHNAGEISPPVISNVTVRRG